MFEVLLNPLPFPHKSDVKSLSLKTHFSVVPLSVILLEWLYQLTNLKSDEIVMIRSQVIFS